MLSLNVNVTRVEAQVTVTECMDVLDQCDKAVNLLVPIVKDQLTEIERLNQSYDKLLVERIAAEERSPFEDPLLTVPISFLLGAFIGHMVAK